VRSCFCAKTIIGENTMQIRADTRRPNPFLSRLMSNALASFLGTLLLSACIQPPLNATDAGSTDAVDAGPPKPSSATFLLQKDVKYTDIIPNTVAFGTAFGSLMGPTHGTFVKIKKGQGTPLHTHSTVYRAVVISGLFENPVPGIAATELTLGPGDYYTVPAGEEHVSRCSMQSTTDCMTFFWQESGFDFTPQDGGTENAGGPTVTFVKQQSVTYQEIIPGAVSFGPAFGDRSFGAHGTFVRIKKGATTPSHLHSNPYRAVVISGTFENPTLGSDASNASFGPGTYYSIPGGEQHISRCSANSATDCLTFFWQSTQFDFTPIP
jgi:quercetin dioxygenase-like cupin family protein